MKFISHRGNIDGKDILKENLPEQIDYCISIDLDVEIDLWFIDKKFFLGHDKPQYEISYNWLKIRKENLWIHCKNLAALEVLIDKDLNYFWHQEDDFTLTSKQFIWTYPNKQVTNKSVIVLFDKTDDIKNCYGICSDYIKFEREKYNA
jgi:hypothetical protein